jgi:hypothetical protein
MRHTLRARSGSSLAERSVSIGARSIDERGSVIVSELFFSASLKRQEAGDARQMDVRERGKPLPKRSQKTPWVSQHGDKSFARFVNSQNEIRFRKIYTAIGV